MSELYKELKDKRIGYALTGSFCTLEQSMCVLQRLQDCGAELMPIISFNVKNLDTKFGPAQKWQDRIYEICGKPIAATITEAEPIGPKALLDILVILPCSGNTLGKLANGITDTPVTMAAKAHLRNNKPLLIGVSTNDGLSTSAQNIGRLMNNKNIYLIPFGQDAPHKKYNSLLCDFDLCEQAVIASLEGRQLQPVLK